MLHEPLIAMELLQQGDMIIDVTQPIIPLGIYDAVLYVCRERYREDLVLVVLDYPHTILWRAEDTTDGYMLERMMSEVRGEALFNVQVTDVIIQRAKLTNIELVTALYTAVNKNRTQVVQYLIKLERIASLTDLVRTWVVNVYYPNYKEAMT
ncbi:Hypothetical protein POVR2_LOCUS338 [uncultured virus]|nr:Hypothetical protein POVR2_LOCUS338 [uncultured virus]